ncbi:hypothetical protein PP353_gp50 [Arthrobacter phage Kumotta]|uniref:Uncharacterized protein n=1 Tax=Arthrobacter phage Kumotta TaxID=2588498 RepID=A0A4Y6ENF4_9CAUD|nr:hypothetical protein PP353_gp50 [Arthrobacter phage Kumotta]QDF19585.1 hypothetical protein SEA_KUMOTTA_50 [Arthrobacter phage Kumotta]
MCNLQEHTARDTRQQQAEPIYAATARDHGIPYQPPTQGPEQGPFSCPETEQQ